MPRLEPVMMATLPVRSNGVFFIIVAPWMLPVIASEAKQSTSPHGERLDCFVAYAPRNDGG